MRVLQFVTLLVAVFEAAILVKSTYMKKFVIKKRKYWNRRIF